MPWKHECEQDGKTRESILKLLDFRFEHYTNGYGDVVYEIDEMKALLLASAIAAFLVFGLFFGGLPGRLC